MCKTFRSIFPLSALSNVDDLLQPPRHGEGRTVRVYSLLTLTLTPPLFQGRKNLERGIATRPPVTIFAIPLLPITSNPNQSPNIFFSFKKKRTPLSGVPGSIPPSTTTLQPPFCLPSFLFVSQIPLVFSIHLILLGPFNSLAST